MTTVLARKSRVRLAVLYIAVAYYVGERQVSGLMNGTFIYLGICGGLVASRVACDLNSTVLIFLRYVHY